MMTTSASGAIARPSKLSLTELTTDVTMMKRAVEKRSLGVEIEEPD